MSTLTTRDGAKIFYNDWGTGQPVVFSHGWPLSADPWEDQMLFLASHGFRCIAHDRRGHGRSRRRPLQLELHIPKWGGRREGAGRKPAPSRSVRHRARRPHDPRCPVHVTLRAAGRIPSMRGGDLAAAIPRALARASRDGFRLLQYSLQSDPLHMLVEADEPTRPRAVCRGLRYALPRR